MVAFRDAWNRLSVVPKFVHFQTDFEKSIMDAISEVFGSEKVKFTHNSCPMLYLKFVRVLLLLIYVKGSVIQLRFAVVYFITIKQFYEMLKSAVCFVPTKPLDLCVIG